MEAAESVRIVMVGKTGNGKSATGNTILGWKAFVAKVDAVSVTHTCKKATSVLPDGRSLAVSDTPGFFDTNCSAKTTQNEVQRCVSICAPGPHVILQVIRLSHFSPKEKEVAEIIQRIFSLKSKAYMIVLFTRKEDLEGCLAFNNKAVEEEREAQVAELIRMVDALVRSNRSAPYYTKEMLEADKRRVPGWWCTIL